MANDRGKLYAGNKYWKCYNNRKNYMNPMKCNELTLLTKQKYFFHKNNLFFFFNWSLDGENEHTYFRVRNK